MYLRIACWKVKAIDRFELVLASFLRIMINSFSLNITKCPEIFFCRMIFTDKIHFPEHKILVEKKWKNFLILKTKFKNLILWKTDGNRLK